MADPAHPHYEATKKAIKHAYNMEPDLTREGGSIPVTLTFQVSVYKVENLHSQNLQLLDLSLLTPTGDTSDGYGAYILPLKIVGSVAFFNYYDTVFRADISGPW